MTATAPPPDPPEDTPTTPPRRPAAGPIGVTRTELVWPGKYDEQGRLNSPRRVQLPFQTIETVGESRSTREARKRRPPSLFEVYRGSEGETFEDGWKNKLIWGDNLLVMQSLLDEFAGKIDLIYIDPPFATGADFSFRAPVGEDDSEASKEPSLLEEKAYRDTWRHGIASYVSMMSARLRLTRELLSEHGSLYVHCDWRVNSHLRIALDDVFGHDCFQREIIWRIGWISGYKSSAKNWIRNHDTILYYTKDPQRFTFNKEYMPYPADYVRRDGKKPTGSGYPVEDVWNANPTEHALKGEESLDSIQIKSFSTEKTGYETQKNESVLRRIIRAASNPNDLVADFFCGSGTTAAVAEKLGRRWIGCDLGRWAIHLTRKRLLDIENCKPFTLLNLGKYERQHWQGVTFRDGSPKEDRTRAYYQYLAFVLKLYGAAPIPGMDLLHGRKESALIHVGPVDAPVTIGDVEGALNECARAQQKELHVLGWEWEMGLQSGTERQSGSLIHRVAKGLGVNKLRLLQIPREVMEQQAADKGDIQFFELAYLEAKIEAGARPRERRVSLTDFVVPNWDSVPEDVRDKITKWSDWIDYWAVDWDFRHDSFTQGFVAYRTRKDRKLDLVSDPHLYEEAGGYRVLVKVVDIFGNDTSRAWDIEVP